MTHNSRSESHLIHMNKRFLVILKWFWSEGDADCGKKTQSAHALPYSIRANMFAYSTPLSVVLDLKDQSLAVSFAAHLVKRSHSEECYTRCSNLKGHDDVLHECLFVREAELAASHPVGGAAMQHASAYSRNKRARASICSSLWPMDPSGISIAEQGMMGALEC